MSRNKRKTYLCHPHVVIWANPITYHSTLLCNFDIYPKNL